MDLPPEQLSVDFSKAATLIKSKGLSLALEGSHYLPSGYLPAQLLPSSSGQRTSQRQTAVGYTLELWLHGRLGCGGVRTCLMREGKNECDKDIMHWEGSPSVVECFI